MDTFMRPTGTLTAYWPSLISPPAVGVLPSTGENPMVPFSPSLPSTLTVPLTSAVGGPLSQPASASRATKAPPRHAAPRMRIRPPGKSPVADDLAAVHRAQRLPGRQRDGVVHEADRAVEQRDVDPGGVPAAGGAELAAGRGHRHERVLVGDGPVDHVRG